MSAPLPTHNFDESRANEYFPIDAFTKLAILVDPPEPTGTTSIRTSFGVQTFRESFYLVADKDGSYGAAKQEFEHSHKQLSENTWVKTSPVHAYVTTESSIVETMIDGRIEVIAKAAPGEWIVRQNSGEIMVLSEADFLQRYRSSPVG